MYSICKAYHEKINTDLGFMLPLGDSIGGFKKAVIATNFIYL